MFVTGSAGGWFSTRSPRISSQCTRMETSSCLFWNMDQVMSDRPLHIQNHTAQNSSRFDTSYATSKSLNSLMPVFVCSDGNFLAIGSHDNYIYIYAVSENGRKYSRVGKCSVSTCIYIPPSSVLCLFLVPPSSFKISSSSAPSMSPPPPCTLSAHFMSLKKL